MNDACSPPGRSVGYHSHNMAACLKGDQTSFVFGGRGKRQTLKLSAPGMKATAELIARIRTRGNGIASKRKGIDRVAVPKASRAMGSSQSNMESSPRSMGALAGLRGHHSAPHQDTVNGGNRGNDLTAAG